MRRPMKSLFAGLLTMAAVTTATPAHASDWGCTVLLCLAGNWGDITECQEPVHRLFRELARGHSFPSCDMSDGNNDGQNYATHGRDPIQDCPPDMVGDGIVKYGYQGPYKDCRSREPVCRMQQGYAGPHEVCEYITYVQRSFRSEPNWIDVYVDGQKYNRVWWR